MARECGRDSLGVKCSLKHRAVLDVTLEPIHQEQSVTFISPGFYRQTTTEPKGAYYNTKYCIFSISLDCPDRMVELIPLEPTNTLSDSDTCHDYTSSLLQALWETNYGQHCMPSSRFMENNGQMTIRMREEGLKLKLDARLI